MELGLVMEGAVLIAKGALMNEIIMNVTAIIKYLTTEQVKKSYPSVTVSLKRLDVQNSFNAVHALVNDMIETKHQFPLAVQISMAGVEEVCMSIHERLQIINRKLEIHGKKWFNRLRATGIMEDLMALEGLSYTLNKRIALLEKITTIAACTGLKRAGDPNVKEIPEKEKKLIREDSFYSTFFQAYLGAPDDTLD